LTLHFQLYDFRDEFEFLNAFDFYQCAIFDGYVEILSYAPETTFDTPCSAEHLPDFEGHFAGFLRIIDVSAS
jgi:hypothetical protein